MQAHVMSMPRYRARRDDNDSVLAVFAAGLGPWLIRTDFPADYLVWFRGQWDLVEIKDPAKQGWASEFTDAQKAFRREAALRGARLIVWRTRADVLAYVGAREAA